MLNIMRLTGSELKRDTGQYMDFREIGDGGDDQRDNSGSGGEYYRDLHERGCVCDR